MMDNIYKKLEMNLAYYEEKDYHTEIMGLFLDFVCQNREVIKRLDYYNDKDQSAFLDHYEYLFANAKNAKNAKNANNVNKLDKIMRFKNAELINKIEEYDYILVGTMGGTLGIASLIEKYPQKFVQVYHNDDDFKNSIQKTVNTIPDHMKTKMISLTPLNQNVAPYLLPIFDVDLKKSIGSEKIIAIVGRFTQHRTYEALLPLLNLDYTIWIISRRVKFVPQPLVDLSKTNPKLRISYKLNAQKMSEILLRSKYILCMAEDDSWYYRDRLTGTIPLSLNYEVPILIPTKLNKIYDLHGTLSYDIPEEIPAKIREIEERPGGYENIVEDLIKQKKEIVLSNRSLLSSILN